MLKSFRKIVLLALIIGLNWSGIPAIGETFAFFSNTENSTNNIFQAGILDMTVRSGQGNFVPGADKMTPGKQVNRDIYIGKTAGSSSLKHKVSFEIIGDNEELCSQLDLKIWYNHYKCEGNYADCRDMRLAYSGKLSALSEHNDDDFIILHPDDQFDNDPSDGTEQWFYYSIILPTGISSDFQGEVCKFNFVFDGWQTNFPDDSQGFTDKEKLESTIKVSYWEPFVVLNEFLPNAGNYPEFIELYNQTSIPIDLDGFYIMADNNRIDITSANTSTYSGGLTTISPNSWLVITAGGDLLDDSSGTLTLYNPSDVEIDSYTYSGGDYNINNNPGWTNNLVGYWPFDNNSVLDISGNNNDGTNHGASFVPGKINKALSFDGLDDYVSIASSNDFDFGSGEFSAEFWIKTNSSLRQWVGTRYENYGPGWGLGTQNNHALGYIRTLESGTSKTEIEGTSVVANDNWHHLMLTRVGDKIKLYTDGSFEIEGTLAGSVSNNEPIEIGRISWSDGSQYLNGLVDEVKVYNRALNSNEVLEHYNAVGSGNSVPLDKSYARIPDGSPNWVDPFPTPGGPNSLESTRTIPKVDSIFQPEEQDPIELEPEEEIVDVPEEELVTESDSFSAQGGETASSSEDLIIDSEEGLATESESFSAQGGPAAGWEEDGSSALESEEENIEEIDNSSSLESEEENIEEEPITKEDEEQNGITIEEINETIDNIIDEIMPIEEEAPLEDVQTIDETTIIEESTIEEVAEELFEQESNPELNEEDVNEMEESVPEQAPEQITEELIEEKPAGKIIEEEQPVIAPEEENIADSGMVEETEKSSEDNEDSGDIINE